MALVLIIIGFLAFIAGAAIYFRSKRRNELTLIYSNKLIETKPNEGVEMLYLGKPISHFVRYEITLFNTGSRDIKPYDFSPQPELAFYFKDLQVVSEKAGFSSEGVGPHYQIESPEVVVYFDKLKPNQHMTVEVLTGSHSDKLTPPICNAIVRGGNKVIVHNQVFDEADAHGKYRHLSKHIAVTVLAFVIGASGLITGLYQKFQSMFSGRPTSFEQQIVSFFSTDSLLWLAISIVSVIALVFSIESLKVIAPKFRRYKFEQLVQNRE